MVPETTEKPMDTVRELRLRDRLRRRTDLETRGGRVMAPDILERAGLLPRMGNSTDYLMNF